MAKAQEGIIHVSMNDTVVMVAWQFDFDRDGMNDVRFYWDGYPAPPCVFGAEAKAYNDTAVPYVVYTPWRLNIRNNYGDTISSITEWKDWEWGKYFDYPYLETYYEEEYLTAVKLPLSDGKSCYGWVSYKVCGWPMEHNSGRLVFHEYAYCTIPDYPLRVGQTSFNWDLAEQESSADPVIQPNPTSGVFTLSCENLCQIDIYNAMGQHIVTRRASEDSIALDLSNQPSGVYFVSIIAQEGKRCVKKVVKQ